MLSQSNTFSFSFQPLGARAVVADFNAGHISSDAGALLLRELEATSRVIERFADCFVDLRNQNLIEHSVRDLVGQRIFGLVLGYEDLNDHDSLRLDPLLATLVGKLDPTGLARRYDRDKGKPLAGKSTLNRLELTPVGASSDDRYKKILYLPSSMDELLVRIFVENSLDCPEEIILDFDTTDDPVHGQQEGRFFHGYYDEYCYLPLYVFCGHDLLLARLNTADLHPAKAAIQELPALVQRIRRQWPHVRILVRGDSAFSSNELMAWCERHQVNFVFGLSSNSRLLKQLEPSLEDAKKRFDAQAADQRNSVRCYHDFNYRTLDTWSRERRVIGKAEHLPDGPNPRFVVTSLDVTLMDGPSLYEKLYCARGDMENRLKEQQMGLFADRTSTHTLRGNQLRLMFSSIAYVLVNLLRRYGLRGTEMAKAQVSTIRLRLFKIGAMVRISVRRVWLQMSTAYPAQSLFSQVLENLRTHGALLKR